MPKVDVERTCRAAGGAGVPGHDAAEYQRDEQDARSKLEKEFREIAVREGKTVAELVAAIDRGINRENLSSAIRYSS